MVLGGWCAVHLHATPLRYIEQRSEPLASRHCIHLHAAARAAIFALRSVGLSAISRGRGDACRCSSKGVAQPRRSVGGSCGTWQRRPQLCLTPAAGGCRCLRNLDASPINALVRSATCRCQRRRTSRMRDSQRSAFGHVLCHAPVMWMLYRTQRLAVLQRGRSR